MLPPTHTHASLPHHFCRKSPGPWLSFLLALFLKAHHLPASSTPQGWPSFLRREGWAHIPLDPWQLMTPQSPDPQLASPLGLSQAQAVGFRRTAQTLALFKCAAQFPETTQAPAPPGTRTDMSPSLGHKNTRGSWAEISVHKSCSPGPGLPWQCQVLVT